MTTKYPKCECETKRYSYFRRRYRNGTLHLMRKCEECGKTGQNAMRVVDYDTNWVDTLPIVDKGVTSEPMQNANPVQRIKPVQNMKPVQSRADRIHAKLQRHIANR